MITVHEVIQGSAEWLELRDKNYTGTGAEKLLSFSGQLKVIDGVVSPYALSEITGFTGNFYTRRGHILEDEAIDLYRAITGHTVSRPGFITNSKWPGCGYSPDGDDEDIDWPLEVKAFEEKKHLELIDGKISVKILAQIHWGQFIWEKKGARLLAYNPRFAKKIIDGIPNPNYNPSKALGIVDIKFNRNINNNFKRILRGVA